MRLEVLYENRGWYLKRRPQGFRSKKTLYSMRYKLIYSEMVYPVKGGWTQFDRLWIVTIHWGVIYVSFRYNAEILHGDYSY